MVRFNKFEEKISTRKALRIDEMGSRVLCIIVIRELTPITTLSGPFLLAWWKVVECEWPVLPVFLYHPLTTPIGHRALWKRGVHHRGISTNNTMGYCKCDVIY